MLADMVHVFASLASRWKRSMVTAQKQKSSVSQWSLRQCEWQHLRANEQGSLADESSCRDCQCRTMCYDRRSRFLLTHMN